MTTRAKKTPTIESTGNVFEDLGFEKEEAALLKLRAELAIALEAYIKAKGWSQREAAKRLGVHQPRISTLMKGKAESFSLDSLVELALRAGMRASIAIAEAPKRRRAA